MPQLNWPAVAAIAVLGAIFTMAVPETETKSSSSIKKISHSPSENIDNIRKVSPPSSVIRCSGKRAVVIVNDDDRKTIEEITTDRNATANNTNGFSICEWQDIDSGITVPSQKFDEERKRFAVKRETASAPIISPDIELKQMAREENEKRQMIRDDRSLGEDIVEVTEDQRALPDELENEALLFDENGNSRIEDATIIKTSTESYQTINIHTEIFNVNRKDSSISSNQNSSVDSDSEMLKNLSKNTTSMPMPLSIPQVRSEKLVYQTNTTQYSAENLSSSNSTIGLTIEDTMESPLILRTRTKIQDVKYSESEKSREDIAVEGKPYSRKDHSKPSINLLDGQPNKVFYEIKPSLNTAMKVDDEDGSTSVYTIPTTKRNFLGFKLPSVPSSFGKFGPYFLDEVDRRNVTERIGSTVQLDCRIGLLGDKKVTWLQPNKDSIRLLTVGKVQYSADERISLKFQYPDNWKLQIAYATLRDDGTYKCQVEIDPTHFLVKTYHVHITAPTLNITDDSGRMISGERHLKAGSTLRLRCEGRDVLERLNESLLWTRGDEVLTTDVSENRTTELVDDKEMPVIISTLVVEKASPRHAGNYSCIVPERAKTTIAVHVLNGELPAAVHHGNGVSSAVLNLWLIHLTVSYGFFR